MTVTRFPSSLDASLQLSNQWLEELQEMLNTDAETTYGALRGTLQTLRDSLTVDEAAHLSAQLPMLIKGIFFTGWKPSKVPVRRDTTEFLEVVRDRSGLGEQSIHPLAAARGVIELMRKHVTGGELEDVLGQLPSDLIETLKPATGQT